MSKLPSTWGNSLSVTGRLNQVHVHVTELLHTYTKKLFMYSSVASYSNTRREDISNQIKGLVRVRRYSNVSSEGTD